MAGKYALYFPYKIIDALQAGKVKDSEFRQFIIALADYDRIQKTPVFENAGLTMLFESIRPEIDVNNEKYQALVDRSREAGKLGGAPLGNKNAAGNRGGGAPIGNRNASKKPAPENKHNQKFEFETESKKQTQAEQNSTVQIKNSSSSEVVLGKQPTTTTTEYIISTCKALGFSMTKNGAQKILGMGIDPDWLTGPHNFLEYTITHIQEAYSEKSQEAQRRLFYAALGWPDRREEFMSWREAETAKAEAKERRRREASQHEAAEKAEREQIMKDRENHQAGPGLSESFREQLRNRGGPGP